MKGMKWKEIKPFFLYIYKLINNTGCWVFASLWRKTYKIENVLLVVLP